MNPKFTHSVNDHELALALMGPFLDYVKTEFLLLWQPTNDVRTGNPVLDSYALAGRVTPPLGGAVDPRQDLSTRYPMVTTG